MRDYFKKHLRQAGLGLLALLVPLFLSGAPVAAQADSLLFGQRHRYSVIFRGNGEAIVYAKLIVTNSDDEPMTDFSFEIPRVEPYEMAVYQMELPQECAEYDYSKSNRQCKRYRDPDYDGYYYYGYSNKDVTYTKIKPQKIDKKYSLELPKAVEPNKTTAIILTYAGKGYVKNTLATQKFEFETPKVASRIQEVNVAVDVDSDLILRGKRTQIDYNSPDSMLKADTATNEGVSSRELDRWQRRIGWGGVVQKEAKNLAPNESMIVRGEYATSWFKLYLKQILLSLAIIAAIVIGSILLSKRWAKRRDVKTSEKIIEKAEKAVSKTVDKIEAKLAPPSLSRHILISLVAAVLTVALVGLIAFISELGISEIIAHHPVLILLFMLLAGLFIGLTLLGPAIYIGLKYGWRQGLKLFAIECGWIVLLAVIVAVFVLISSDGSSSAYPIYYD